MRARHPDRGARIAIWALLIALLYGMANQRTTFYDGARDDYEVVT